MYTDAICLRCHNEEQSTTPHIKGVNLTNTTDEPLRCGVANQTIDEEGPCKSMEEKSALSHRGADLMGDSTYTGYPTLPTTSKCPVNVGYYLHAATGGGMGITGDLSGCKMECQSQIPEKTRLNVEKPKVQPSYSPGDLENTIPANNHDRSSKTNSSDPSCDHGKPPSANTTSSKEAAVSCSEVGTLPMEPLHQTSQLTDPEYSPLYNDAQPQTGGVDQRGNTMVGTDMTCKTYGSDVKVHGSITFSTSKLDGIKPGKIVGGVARSDLEKILFPEPHQPRSNQDDVDAAKHPKHPIPSSKEETDVSVELAEKELEK